MKPSPPPQALHFPSLPSATERCCDSPIATVCLLASCLKRVSRFGVPQCVGTSPALGSQRTNTRPLPPPLPSPPLPSLHARSSFVPMGHRHQVAAAAEVVVVVSHPTKKTSLHVNRKTRCPRACHYQHRRVPVTDTHSSATYDDMLHRGWVHAHQTLRIMSHRTCLTQQRARRRQHWRVPSS